MATVRRQARKLMRGLTVPSPWSVAELCVQVGELRGREIVLEPVSGGTATASVRRELTRDVVSYRADHHNPDHLIAHELGHLRAGDLDGPVDLSHGVDADVAEAARIMLRNCDYGSLSEQVAEAFADLVMEQALRYAQGSGVSAGTARRLRGYGEAMR